MTGLATVFKRVYGEALASYGFVKLKGRQPYFVRLIGDEILHVITVKNESAYCFRQYYKAFDILGGIKTVYDWDLELEKTPRNNTFWLENNAFIYGYEHLFDLDNEYRKSILKFEYREGSEQALFDAMRYSFEVTKRIMLYEMNKVIDLESYMAYYHMLHKNPEILNYKMYTIEEYTQVQEKLFEEIKRDILYRVGKGEYTDPAKKRIADAEDGMLKSVALFKEIMSDPQKYAEVMKELEDRKARNTEKLRQYGLGREK